MATEAVLLIHIDSKAAAAPTAKRMRAGEEPIKRERSMPRATRRSSWFTVMARASRKLPRKTKITGLAKPRKTSRASPTPNKMQRAGPSNAVAGMGMASVTQKAMTSTSTAARLRCSRGRLAERK